MKIHDLIGKTLPKSRRLPGSIALQVFYLALAMIVMGTLQTGMCGDRSVRYCPEALSESGVIDLTNVVRTSEGLATLNHNTLLTAIAEERAKDMIERQYFGHVSPSGDRVALVASRSGYQYKVIAENLAAGMFSNSQRVVDAWLQSPGHRKNILSSQVRDIGVSVLKGRINGTDGWVVVQVFGTQQPLATYASNGRDSFGYQTGSRDGELDSPSARLNRWRLDLDKEKESIQRDTRRLARSSSRIQELNARISAYNSKAGQYNQTVAGLRETRSLIDATPTESSL
jgi:uncharacterized protein YkwD